MKRRQNIFLFLENTENFEGTSSKRMDLNLVRLYVNKYIIDEDDQCEIQAVIPLMEKKHPYDMNEKNLSDQEAVLEQLDQLGYKYFIEEPCVTHFIFTLVQYPYPAVGPWIEYWFNENAVKYQHLNPNYRFVFTSLSGSKLGISNKEQVKFAYSMAKSGQKRFNFENYAIPVDIDIEDFEQTITANQILKRREKGSYNWITNLNKVSYLNESFFYKQLTDSEIKNISDYDLETSVFRKIPRLQLNLDNTFRWISGQRNSVIISPKSSFWFLANKRRFQRNKPYDQRLQVLKPKGTMRPTPIKIPGRRGTALYFIERDRMLFIMNDDEDLLDNY